MDRRALLLIVFLGMLAGLAFTYFIFPQGTPSGIEEEGMAIFHPPGGDVKLSLEIADTPEEQSKGLMYREHLDPGAGMLFIFSMDTNLSFWMKNTLIPLDMVFINSSMQIISIQDDVQPCRAEPCPTYGSGGPAMYVIEANAGFAEAHGIAPGQQVSLSWSVLI